MRNLIRNIKFNIKKSLVEMKPIILTYHSIHSGNLPFPIWTQLDYLYFEQHLQFLSSNFNCISLESLQKQIQNGNFEPYSVVVTFDDGYHNNFFNAYPLLLKYKIPATIFVTAGFVDKDEYIWSDKIAAILSLLDNVAIDLNDVTVKIESVKDKAVAYRMIVNRFKALHPDEIKTSISNLMEYFGVSEENLKTPLLKSCFGHLDWDEIIIMRDSGLIEIGSHGMSHSILARLSDKEAKAEIFQSKNTIETKLARFGPVKFFAYPNGGENDFTRAHRNLLIESNYQGVLTTRINRVDQGSDCFELPRVCIGDECSVNYLRYLMCQ
ncbi:polysaccharide deacetylase domain protein [Geotalea daltonii FRC-32]|uniref:Polysaccharide deacetylase domain protein n=1 Tax=Geotalea daltonii (strain DSM 22248 / JCM 15807 / FRC-32) TaxID=316067 RepID=B9M2V0_GEODF|nr:polysaccharide deacetylase family protein [Geotalea daltonii]ACM21296.1 polysaccharide deacetylase domain protein [Geotalea daltonii FRC-32]